MLIINGWLVRPDTCTLSRGEEARKISPRCMDVLCHLAQNPDEVISSSELLDKFWLRSSASDHAVHNVLASLRQAFKEEGPNREVIRTYPKRGYALVAKVEQIIGIQQPEAAGSAEHSDSKLSFVPAIINQLALNFGGHAQFKLLCASLVFLVTLIAFSSFHILAAPKINSLRVEFLQTEQKEASVNYLERGFDHSLVNSLTKIPNLRLGFSGPNSLFDLNLPLLEKSQAKYLLSVQKDTNESGLTVSLSLSEVGSSEVLMLEVLEITPTNFIGQHERLLEDLGSALRVYLDSERVQGMSDWGTSSAIAYDNFIKAEFYAEQYNHDDWNLAVAHYEKAICEDVMFVNAYVGLGSAINLMAVYSRNEKSAELKSKLNEYSRQLEMLLPNVSAVHTLKSLALNIDGVSQQQLEESYRRKILAGGAPDYVFAQYALFLIGARLYKEAGEFLILADSPNSFIVSPNDGWNYRTLILTPWEIVPVKKAQLYDRPAHIGILGKLIYSLALQGEFDEAEYFLAQQSKQDKEGIRKHLSQIIVSAANGNLMREYLQKNAASANKRAPPYPDFNVDGLLSESEVNDPNLQFNNGILQFIIGDFEKGAAHWHNLKTADQRSLYTRIHALEMFFSTSIVESPRYPELLEELGVGASWQRRLIDGVEEMQFVTGIVPSRQAGLARSTGKLMLTNNNWSPDDWQKLKLLRRSRIEKVRTLLSEEGLLRSD